MNKASKAALIAVQKSTDELRVMADKIDKEALEMRADTELGHLPGSLSDRVALLTAIDGIEDEGQRKNALVALQKPPGFIPDTPREGTPEADLDTMAKAHQEAHPGETIEVAYSEVLATAKGQDLYTKCVN